MHSPRLSLQKMLQANNIPDDWDYLLIGDGSGSSWGYKIGWACMSIEKRGYARKLWLGGANDGTVNIAEGLAYLQPLMWIYQLTRETPSEQSFYTVRIITDSQYLARASQQAAKPSPTNAPLFACFNQFPRWGIMLHWHWAERNTTDLSEFVDAMSKHARRAALKQNDERLQTQIDIYSLNPAGGKLCDRGGNTGPAI